LPFGLGFSLLQGMSPGKPSLSASAEQPRPLDGVRVVKFSQMVMGPSCGLILADLGADVVKVEPLKGDRTRTFKGPAAGFFGTYCRNMRSIALNTSTAEGQRIARRLIEHSDVLIENFRPGLLKRIGLDYESVASFAPRLIYCSLKGYLPGPYENRLALDEVVQMMGGLAYMTGLPDRPMRRRFGQRHHGRHVRRDRDPGRARRTDAHRSRAAHPERVVRKQRIPDGAGDDVRDGDR
jgi:crotonobetainyl-CoA:carnitine CoA-transferase CaiB-like acyl-CoA transferase